jgi:hypothetical protein
VYELLCLLMAEREEYGQGLVRQPKVDSLRVAHSSFRRRWRVSREVRAGALLRSLNFAVPPLMMMNS